MNSKIPTPEYMNDIHLIIDLGMLISLSICLYKGCLRTILMNGEDQIKPHKYILILF